MHLLNLASCLLLSLSGEDPLLFGTVMLRETETIFFVYSSESRSVNWCQINKLINSRGHPADEMEYNIYFGGRQLVGRVVAACKKVSGFILARDQTLNNGINFDLSSGTFKLGSPATNIITRPGPFLPRFTS